MLERAGETRDAGDCADSGSLGGALLRASRGLCAAGSDWTLPVLRDLQVAEVKRLLREEERRIRQGVMRMTEKKVLTIDRARWRRGGDDSHLVAVSGITALLNDKGLMCCLGFDALACGLSSSRINSLADPCALFDEGELEGFEDYKEQRIQVTRRYDGEDDYHYDTAELTAAASSAITHNDDPKLSESEREQLIRADLIALGWDDVVFV